MNRAITALRWTLALVLGAQSAIFGLETLRTPPLNVPHALVAAAELLGASLLLLPHWRRKGAALLVATLVGAAMLHVAGGEAPPGSFAVYGVSMLVVGRRDPCRAS